MNDLIIQQGFQDAENEIISKEYLQQNNVFNILPVAAYTCDKYGIITNYNIKAVELWGKAPKKGDGKERYCGAYKCYHLDGAFFPQGEMPVAACLADGHPRTDEDMIIERPDHSTIIIRMNVIPIKDEEGNVMGTVSCFYDISDQRQTQRKLEQKTKELKDYLENAAIGLHWVDGNGIIKWANKAELQMLGYQPEEYIGHHISEFHADKDRINDILKRLTSNETLDAYESVLRCKDGSVRTVQITSNVFWENGKFIHTRCFTVDVTEQKRNLKALKESESNYRQLIESLKAAIYTTDAFGRITLYNKAAAELWGREPEIGKDLWCGSYRILKTNGSELPLDDCPMAVALREQRPVTGEEIIVVKPDGSSRNAVPYPQPLFDESGNMVGAVNMLVDTTEFKRSEQALRESEYKLRQLNASLEKMVEERTIDLKKNNEALKKSEDRYHKMVSEVEDYAILLLDKNGIIQNWNAGAEKIKGYKESEIIGKSFKIFYRDQDRRIKLPEKLLGQARKNGKAVHEGWRQRKDGTTFWGSIVITALHDADNNIVGFSKVTRDLTERKSFEDDLKEYASQLEFQNKELAQFAYAASHDLKEPLRKITFYNNYVIESSANGLNEKGREYLNRSISAATRMKKLIEDLLTYSKTSSVTENFQETDLTEIVEEIILSHKDIIEENGTKIELETLPVANVIPFQFKQVMENIINNALKYKHPKRRSVIKISCQTVNGSDIKIVDADAGISYYQISVADNGVGFQPQYAEKIFEIFQRLNNNSDYKGSGMGLAICKRVIQNHRGFIEATGKENEGALFKVYIPAT
jgi:PAS domain S-box-containing protein